MPVTRARTESEINYETRVLPEAFERRTDGNENSGEKNCLFFLKTRAVSGTRHIYYGRAAGRFFPTPVRARVLIII